jgi:hypothetical protein
MSVEEHPAGAASRGDGPQGPADLTPAPAVPDRPGRPVTVEDGSFRLLGVKITDWFAIIGGLIGFAGGIFSFIVSQVWQPDLNLYPVEQVELRCYPRDATTGLCNSDSKVIVTAMSLVYFNLGNPNRIPIVSHESVVVTMAHGKQITLDWHWFANIAPDGEHQTPVKTFTVPSEGAIHDTQFLPQVLPHAAADHLYDNYYSWDQLLKDVAESDKAGQALHLTFQFQAKLLNGDTKPAPTCAIDVDPETVAIWKDPKNDLFQRRFTCL